MPKIAIIGAGGVGFPQTLIQDILSFESLREGHFSLMDVDPERMDVTYQWAQKLIAQENLPTTVSQTVDRAEALEDADYVICVILAHGLEPFTNEIEIPAKYGITQPIGDTLCIGGIFRGLRTIPVLLDICHDMEQYCPGALMLNYTNPMTMLTWACSEGSEVPFIGLCHGVQGTAHEMATLAGVDPDTVRYWTAGINHLAWFLEITDAAGEDLYPRLWEKIERDGPPEGDALRWDLAKHVGYYMTESSGHLSEYIPYYRKRKDLQEQFDTPGHWAGTHGVMLESYRTHWGAHAERTFQQIRGEEPIAFGSRSGEYASRIINALETNELFRLNGNVMNYGGLISNLPEGCCVEVPCLVDGSGIHPCVVGDLPPQCAAIDMMSVNVQTLAVEAALEGDRDKAFYACLVDPLASAMLSPAEIKQMFDELFAANRQWMPQFED